MSIQSQFEREESAIEDQFERGEITKEELSKELRELRRDYSAAAEESAQDAYSRELGNW